MKTKMGLVVCGICVLLAIALTSVAQEAAQGAGASAAAQGTAQAPAAEGKWISLFNGKDLEGWTPKFRGCDLGENFRNTFRVENGILEVRYDQYPEFKGEFGHLFYKDTFKNFRLRAEYRFVGEQLKGGPSWAFRNNGLMILGQSAESMEKDQSYPASIEVQLLGGGEKDERPTGNLCTPGTNVVINGELIRKHVTNSTSKTFRGDQWVTVEVEVRGNKVTHFVNGEKVLEYTDPQLDENDKDGARLLESGQPKMLSGGTISIQSESHPTDFRKIEIMELSE